jgi:hypothetical protein
MFDYRCKGRRNRERDDHRKDGNINLSNPEIGTGQKA